VLVGSMLPFALVGGGIASGAIQDHSIIRLGESVGMAGRFLVVTCFLVFLVLTYAQARKTRELMVASLVERDSAVRLASHREALILEARQDLDRALSAGGFGRFSDRTLGSFKLGAVLGRGAMGEVYEAVHITTGEPAAVKMLLPEVLNRPAYVHRFLREVRIAASLDARNVVRVLEVGDESAAMPYLAMERLSGEDLATILRREEKLSEDEVVDLVRQVGAGIAAATGAGIVHRDLKPQNLFRTDDDPPVWKILDFGVSKLADDGGSLTRGEAVGTPRYMAPEQARGDDVDGRADLYALGVIAYRALTGNPPFKGDDMPLLLEVLTRMPVRPGSLATLHAHVDAFFALALAKKRDDRFSTAAELAAALEAALAGKLDRRLRERAAAVLATHPWRGVTRERSSSGAPPAGATASTPPPSGRGSRPSHPSRPG
jgi:serine/threonine protein kinase